MDPATILPDELILKILNYLPHSPNFANLACLSKRWRALVSSTLQSRIKVSLHGFGNRRSICWHPLSIYNDINERSGVSIAIHGHILYIFGGRTDKDTAMNDLHTFDLLTAEWKRVTTNGSRPSPRSNSIMGFVEGKLFIYGGHGCPLQDFRGARFSPSSYALRSTVFNDLYSFSRETNAWRQILMDTEGPRLHGSYNGAFVPSVASDVETYPSVLILFEASGAHYVTFALLPETGFWNTLPRCPQSPPLTSNSALPSRPPMCTLSESDVLVIIHHAASTLVWILSRRARTYHSASFCEGWAWTEVQLRPQVNGLNFIDHLGSLDCAELMCLPKLSHQEWPTVAMLCRIPFSTIRTHLNRRMRSRLRRPLDVSSSSSTSSHHSTTVAQSATQSNPMVQVFDELHDPTQPAGAPGQPLRGAIIRRVASSSSFLASLHRHRRTAASRKRRSSQVSGSYFAVSMLNTSSDEPESDSDTSDIEILALCTLSLSEQPTTSPTISRLVLGNVDGPSDQDYNSNSLPLSHSFAALAYGLGSLFVFGVPRTRLVNVENTNDLMDKGPLVWAISGSQVVCGFETSP